MSTAIDTVGPDARPQRTASTRIDRTVAPLVSVVLPCLNEEASVGICVRQALGALDQAGLPAEVLVVDNGSTDDSARIATAAGARIVAERRVGYGNALRAGFAAARGEVIVMADADLTYDLSRIPDLVRPILQREADLVVGARLQDATGGAMPLLHRLVGTPLLTFLVARASGGVGVSDSQSGFRAFRRDAILQLGLRGSGMELASEMLIQAARAGWRVREVRTHYASRVGESKLDTFRDGLRHLRLITMLAPDLLLVYPGASLLLLGGIVSVLSLVEPSGISLGSLRWQPVFFSGIAMVFGAQALFAGLIMAYRSSLTSPRAKRRFAFVGRASFPRRCVRAGIIGVLLGLGIDATLFGWWVTGHSEPSRGLALADVARSLLILGSGIATFGGVVRLILERRRAESDRMILGLEDLGPVELQPPVPEHEAVSA